jgi:hypothetical protein
MKMLVLIWIVRFVLRLFTRREAVPPVQEPRRPRVPDPAEHLLR